jgi:hypothetical protein
MLVASPLSGKRLRVVASSDDKDTPTPPTPDAGDALGPRLSLRVSLLIWLVLAGAGWFAIDLLFRLIKL